MGRFAITSLLLLVVLTGCKKKEVVLTYPIDGEEVMPCCTEFTWKGRNNVSYRFQISGGTGFTNPFIDSTLSDKSFVLQQSLVPNKTYYWKVRSENGVVSSSFKITNVTANFLGNHPGLVHSYHWDIMNGVTNIQDYSDTITLSMIANDLHVKFHSSPIDNTTFGQRLYSNEEVLYNLGWHTSQDILDVRLNYVNDSIHIYRYYGGLGSGNVWKYSGQL